MPNRLPPLRAILAALLAPAHRIGARVGAAALARHAAAIVLLPPTPSAADWATLPHGDLLRAIFASRPRKPGEHFDLRVGARGETHWLVGIVALAASPFERLAAAGKLARAALSGEPESLLLWQQGCAEPAAAAALLATVAAVQAAQFELATFKSKPKPARRLRALDVAAGGTLDGFEQALATAAGNNLARWLTALPPNHLDARGYRRVLEALARRLGLAYAFYGEGRLRRLGAGAFLAVSQGSATRDAGIAHLSYRPRRAAGTRRARGRAAAAAGPDVSLVGKGICFDTGGTNLKPHKGMLDMHADMEGSAVALGSLYALHMLGSPLRVDCWLAITENRIGPTAYKPQDVVRALNGTTIQVIHTDAEGRMVLADALALAARARPGAIIDYATLTGACVYALTERYSGAFTNRPEQREAIEAAGASSGERVWCFPMDEDYDTDIDSSVADVMQCAVEGKGDHILAARFLGRFVPKNIPWLHLDLSAGTRTGGLGHIGTDITGFGVRYTIELLKRGWPAPVPA
jgi:leucyl aminopeptidase